MNNNKKKIITNTKYKNKNINSLINLYISIINIDLIQVKFYSKTKITKVCNLYRKYEFVTKNQQ